MTVKTGVIATSQEVQTSGSRHVAIIWLVGMFLLLPVELIKLPLNVSLVDVWTMAAIPIVWISVPRGRQQISTYYTVPMWLILVGSFASTLGAPAARNGLIVIVKELFVYLWFITLIIALVRLTPRDFHRVLVIWAAVVLVHGLLIVAQFISPEFWRLTAEHLGRGESYEIYRPSGLLANANSAAFFQLLGFVPLMLFRPPRKLGAILALVLIITMLATGSMASILALAAGSILALVILAVKGRVTVIARLFGRLTIASVLVGTLFVAVVGQNDRYQFHLSRILVGRADRSSEGRFDLWARGINVFVEEDVFLTGIGPENFRVVDGGGKQLHNDFLAFSVERGLIGIFGLGLFVLLAVIRAINLFLITDKHRQDDAELVVIVLLAAMAAALVYSITHQVFHNRQLWMILALQEAMYFNLVSSGFRLGIPRLTMKAESSESPQYLLGSGEARGT